MKLQNPFRTALVATLGVGVGIVLLTSIQQLSTILLYVGTALFLSLGLEPIIRFLERRKLPRWAAVLITILGLLGVFVGIILLVVPIIVNQVSQLVVQIQALVQSGTFNPVDAVHDWMQSTFPALNVDTVFTSIENWLNSQDWNALGGSITESLINIGGSLIAGFTGAFIVLIPTIYMTASTPALKASIYKLVPASKRPRFVEIAEQIFDSVGLFVIGQLTLGAINGVLSAILLTVIGAPFPAVLAVIAGICSTIPLVGTLTGSTIIVLTCFIPGLGSHEWTGFVAAGYYLVYMQIEAYFISPKIMSRAVSVPGAIVVIAALAGGALLQLLGALIAIPIAASLLIIYRQVIVPRQNER